MSNVERVHINPAGDKVTILHGDLGNVFQFRGTDYKLESIQAVIDLVQRKGSPERTVLFYNEQAVSVILDDSIMDRPQDKATYGFTLSDAFAEWQNIFGRAMSQKSFVDFLRRRPVGEIEDLDQLLGTVQNLKIATEIIGEYQTDDINNITLMFKSADGEGSAKIPRLLQVTLILLNESDFEQTIEVELEWQKPKAENERPVFVLSCPKVQRYIKEAVDNEVAKLKAALDGYLILAGAPK